MLRAAVRAQGLLLRNEANFAISTRSVDVLAHGCGLQNKKQLRGLSPKRGFVARQAIKGTKLKAAGLQKAVGKLLRRIGSAAQSIIPGGGGDAIVPSIGRATSISSYHAGKANILRWEPLVFRPRISSPWICIRPVSMLVDRRKRQNTEASLATSSREVAVRGWYSA